MTDETELNFEQAFARLEEILEKLNSTQVSLDDSLKLYEEADRLIVACSRRLSEAEQKVELLMKHRDGTLALGAEGAPLSEPFPPNTDSES